MGLVVTNKEEAGKSQYIRFCCCGKYCSNYADMAKDHDTDDTNPEDDMDMMAELSIATSTTTQLATMSEVWWCLVLLAKFQVHSATL